MKALKQFFLATAILVCSTPLSRVDAQSAPNNIETISIKKSTEQQALQQVGEYLTKILNIKKQTDEESYSGIIEDMYVTREGKFKNRYCVNYTVVPVVQPGKLILNFYANEILQDAIICDRTQKEEIICHPASALTGNLREGFKIFTHDLADCARNYIKKGETSIPKKTGMEYWYALNYVVEPAAVSYFTVIQSEKGMPKEDLYKIFENYFTYAYRSGKAVIENKNPDDCTIIAKGVYKKIHNWGNQEIYDVSHIINVQCRDGRVRISITISDYDINRVHTSPFVPEPHITRNIADYKPFGEKSDEEMDECLKKIEAQIITQFIDMKKAIEEGNIGVDNLDNW